jgi:hypothetical protein
MDFKFERFLHVDSSLSAEQQEKVVQMLLKVSRKADRGEPQVPRAIFSRVSTDGTVWPFSTREM